MKSPFKFLDSFTKEDRKIFFGREKEIEELYQRIFRSKIMLVYGVSGTGKSSLINCGLANKFQDEDWLPLNVRRGKNILESMYGAIVGASLTPKAEFSASEVQFRKYVKSLYLDYYKPVYFIFDQFEELFIFGDREEKSQFVRVVKTLIESDIQCRFIFVMREEYMASVTEFEKHIPVFFSNRVRIENMDINNAIQAVKGPCRVADISVEEGFAEALIENLSPGSPDIELTYLQVFLDKVYRLGMEEMEASRGEKTTISFTLDQLKKVGNVSDLLGSFLNEQISLLTDPETALAVLKSFVSVKGTKRQMTLEDVKEYSQTLGKPIDDSSLLEMLQNFVHLRILRDKDQHDRYELRHDSLATKIFEKISGVEKDILEIRQFIEDGYHNWEKRGVLLAASDLDYIAPYESRLYLSSELLSFINQSKNQLEKIKQMRRAIFVVSTFVLLIVFAGFTVWALIERNKSKKQELIANANYYNALSKELVNTDPSKAIHLANYANKLNPSLDNYQNLVSIYSGNEFYYQIFNDKKFLNSSYKVINSNAIAIMYQKSYYSGGQYLDLYTVNEKMINKWDIKNRVIRWDISSDMNSLITVEGDTTLRIYDRSGSLKFKKRLVSYPREIKVLSNNKFFYLFYYNYSTFKAQIYFYSINGELIDSKVVNFERNTSLRQILTDTASIYCILYNGSLYRVPLLEEKTTVDKIDLEWNEFLSSAGLLDGKRIVITTSKKKLYFYSLQGDKINSNTTTPDYNIHTIIPVRKKGFFYSIDNTGISLWDKNGTILKTLKIKNLYDSYSSYDSVNSRLIFSYSNQFYAWDLSEIENKAIYTPKKGHSAFIVNGRIIDYSDDSISLHNIEGNKLKSLQKLDKQSGWQVLPSSNYILIRDNKNVTSPIRIIDWEAKTVSEPKGIDYSFQKYTFSKNDSYFISTIGNQQSYFGLWSFKGTLIKTFIGHDNPIWALKISDDNKTLISGDDGGNIFIWDTTGKKITNYRGHSTIIISLDISFDGNFILSGSIDGTAKLWNKDGRLLYTFESPERNTSVYVKFFPDDYSFYVTDFKNLRIFNSQGVLLQTFEFDNSADNIYFTEDKSYTYFFKDGGIRKIKLKEPIDEFLGKGRYADLTISEKLEYGYLHYKELLKLTDPDHLFSAASYYRSKSTRVIESREKNDLFDKAEALYRICAKIDTSSIRSYRSLNGLMIEKALSTNEKVDDKLNEIFRTLLMQNTYEKLFDAGSYYQINTNNSTIAFNFPDKAITIFKKIISLYPDKKKELDSQVGSLAWQLVLLRQFKEALDACLLALEVNPKGFYANVNIAPCYLLVDSIEKAKKLYKDLKNRPVPLSEIQNNEKIFGNVFKSDLKDLKNRGFEIKEYDEILKILEADTVKLNE